MFKNLFKKFTLLSLTFFITGWASIFAADAICYNCPPQWADWASQLKMIKKHLKRF